MRPVTPDGELAAATLQLRSAARTRPWLGERAMLHLLVAPATLMLAIFYVYPLCRVLWISVTEPTVGLGNYLQLASPSILKVAWTTARICLSTTVITIIFAYLVAYALTHARRVAQRLMLVGVLLPLWVSVLVRSFAWIALLRREGVINTALMSSGIIDHPLSMLWNDFGVIVGMVHYMLPFGILPLVASMRQIDPALMAAARGLGAGRREAFFRVFMPLSLPGIIAAATLVFIFSLGFYVTPTLLGGGRIQMVTEYISIQIIEVVRWGIGTMLATTLIVAVALLLGVTSRILDIRNAFGAK